MTVTLEQLREEFEAARDRHHEYHVWNWEPEDAAKSNRLDSLIAQAEETQDELIAIQEAARRYVIARDFNEFDPQTADMLWKLQRQ
jgi:tRNA U38,U39,U40 pseudouridine synthase TruA